MLALLRRLLHLDASPVLRNVDAATVVVPPPAVGTRRARTAELRDGPMRYTITSRPAAPRAPNSDDL